MSTKIATLTNEEPLLEAVHLRKEFPLHKVKLFGSAQAVHAVEDVSLALRPGHATALVGESGSGKTTVARLLARLYAPTSGSIRYREEKVKTRGEGALRAYRRHVQIIFQDPFSSLNPMHSVYHHLSRPLRIHGHVHRAAEEMQLVTVLLERVNLTPAEQFIHKFPHQLSGGQRQRVAIARALAARPSVLLADEPVSMLDVSIRLDILNLLTRLKEEEHLALLFITHDLASARYFAEETLVMYAGQMVEGGPSEAVIQRPKHPYTQLLLSAAPVPDRFGVNDRQGDSKGSSWIQSALPANGNGSGDVPSLINPPGGCRFHLRCPHAMPICRQHFPPRTELGGEHWVHCFLYGAENKIDVMETAHASFPVDFLWGAATSSYQIEGAAHEDGRGLSIWDQFAAIPGNVYRGENGDVAADHYHRMPEDVALMAELGLNAYRFSIAWPRILPQGTGAINGRGLDFYDRLVDTLLARGITPFVTLYHWDLPLALHEKNGWLNRDTACAFADYAEVVVKRLGDRVDWWTTLNEPWCSAHLGYYTGTHAPGIRNKQSAYVAAHHLLLAHGLALPRLRAHARKSAQLGITLNLTPVYGANDRPETLQAVKLADKMSNRWFLDPIFRGHYPEGLFTDAGVAPPPIQDDDLDIIATPIDVLGVNNYSRTLIRAQVEENEVSNSTTRGNEYVTVVADSLYTEMGWEVYPQALTDVLVRVQRDYAPGAIIVTENGAAFADRWDGSDHISDPQRVDYIRQHLQALRQARARGVPVQGYFAWSLLDNFEWAEGYSKRFGIVYVDYSTQRRIIKDSGCWYAAFIATQREQMVP